MYNELTKNDIKRTASMSNGSNSALAMTESTKEENWAKTLLATNSYLILLIEAW